MLLENIKKHNIFFMFSSLIFLNIILSILIHFDISEIIIVLLTLLEKDIIFLKRKRNIINFINI